MIRTRANIYRLDITFIKSICQNIIGIGMQVINTLETWDTLVCTSHVVQRFLQDSLELLKQTLFSSLLIVATGATRRSTCSIEETQVCQPYREDFDDSSRSTYCY